MKYVIADSDCLSFCCGIDDIGDFSLTEDEERRAYEPSKLLKSGTGLYTAAFIDTPECKAAYLVLCKERLLLFQSELRINLRTGRLLFLCVFKDKA